MRKSIYSFLLVSTAAAGLAGCTVGPDFLRPISPSVLTYTAQPLPPETASADTIAGDAQRFLQDTDVPGEWWTLFRSETLNSLVEQALKANPDTEAAQAALRQAHENYLAQASSTFPQVSGSLSAGHQQPTSGGNQFDLFNASVNVSYLIDTYGGVRRSIEASGALEENARFQLEATYLALTSNVITAAIQAASLSAQIAAIQDIIAAQAQELDLLNQQFELGAVARGDVLAQQSQLASTQASLPPVQKQLEQVRNTLAILVGRFPSEAPIPNIQLTDLQLPPDLPLSLPSRLIAQRPDIRSSEALLHNASAQIGVATANLLPQFQITGNVGDNANQVGSFFSGSNTGWSLIAGLTAPIFRGGLLRAQQRATYDAFDRAAAQYQGTVLNAFANVANVLAALQLDAENVKTQLYAEQTAEQSLEITQERFQAGAIAYLSLLDAQRTYQQARIALVIAQANRFADTVALFQALGGGWWNRQDAPEIRRSYRFRETSMNRPERPSLLVEQRPPRRKRLWLWIVIVSVLALALFAAILAFPIIAFMAKPFPAPPPTSVATAKAEYQNWQPQIQVVGSLKPVRGADLSVEVSGIVDEVDFDSGGDIAAGAQIIRLRDADDIAKLHTLEAARNLAQTNYNRDQAQLQRQLISQAQFDVTAANLQSLQAQVAEQQANVAKKTLRAPFAGHLGIRAVNAGQFINPGTVIVTLQALDPIYLDFYLPQQQLDQIRNGQTVTVKVDAYPAQTFSGRISTIDPKVDPATRNVAVRASVPNPARRLLPGMYATAEIATGKTERYITLPQAAITFNPYGNMVYLLKEATDPAGKQTLTAQQTVVTTGLTRGDQIAILTGLKEGDVVVSAGQTKLQNGSAVVVNNSVLPSNDPNPQPHEQ